MAPEGDLKPWTYYLLRYVPNTARGDYLNVGVLLHSVEEQFLDCLFTDDWQRVKRFHPQADLAFLRELEGYFQQQIQEHEDNLSEFLAEMEQSFANLIQLAPAKPALGRDPQALLPELLARYAGGRRAAFRAAGTRMRIKQQLVSVFRRAGLLDDKRFEKRVPAEPLTHPGDPFHFDFGYRAPLIEGRPNGHLKLIHALSLSRDHALASVLAHTLGYIRRQHTVQLTAAIERWPAAEDKTAGHSYRLLSDAEIAMRPVAEADAWAAIIREELTGI